jgi:hypothetical protein
MKIFLLLMLSSVIINAQIDTVYTKNGEVYYGKVYQDFVNTKVTTEGGVNITLPTSKVDRVNYSISEKVKIQNEFRNPDGDKMSIHFTPYLMGGSQISRINNFDEKYKYTQTWNYNIKVKIPLKNFTIAPFYDSSSTILEIDEKKQYSENNSYLMGVTFSFYIK